jgi:hypothetical protein
MAFIQNTLSNLPPTSGAVFFVDSGSARASDGNAGRDPNVPLATLDAAVARCTANNGDMIVLMPGHDENPLTSITLDVAGIWVYGLGWGASRPTFTFGALAATLSITAASVRVSNIVLDLGAVAATITVGITITGADCIIEDCEILPHATSEFTSMLTTTATADRLTLRRNRFRGLGATAGAVGLTLVGCDDLNMHDNEISGGFSTGAVAQITTAASRVSIFRNLIVNDSAFYALDVHDDTTGLIMNNLIGSGAAFGATLDPGNTWPVENYAVDVADGTVTGAVIPKTAAS